MNKESLSYTKTVTLPHHITEELLYPIDTSIITDILKSFVFKGFIAPHYPILADLLHQLQSLNTCKSTK